MRVPKASERLTALDLEPYFCQIDLAIGNLNSEGIQHVLGHLLRQRRASSYKWRKAIELIDFSQHSLSFIETRDLINQMSYYGHVQKWPTWLSELLLTRTST